MGGFFPKLDEKYGDRDREYNWWGCSEPGWKTLTFFISAQVYTTWFRIDSLAKGWRFCPGQWFLTLVLMELLILICLLPTLTIHLGPLPSFCSIMLGRTSIPPVAAARELLVTRVSFVSAAPLKSAFVSTVVRNELIH